MTNEQGIFLDLEGGDLHPDNLRARELATVISALEAAVVAMVQAETPEIRADQIRLSLVDIKASSIHLAFTPSLAQLTLPAAFRLVEAMRVNQFLGLPALAVQNLRKIVKFLDERGGEARLVVSDTHHALEASIGAAGKLSDFHLTGVTTLYGTVIRVGGVDPRVEFQPVKGKTLFCPAERSIVLQLRDYLYQTVALEGQATWDAATLEVVHFTIRNWYPYVPTSPVAAFAELRERYGRYFDTIDDVDAWVAAVRRGDV